MITAKINRWFYIALIVCGSLFLFLAYQTITNARTGDQKTSSTLKNLGFSSLGNDYYLKPAVFIVKLDGNGRVASLIIPFQQGRDLGGRSLDKYKLIDVTKSKVPGEELILFLAEDGFCTETTVDGGARTGCQNQKGQEEMFTGSERSTGLPLKARLDRVAQLVGPGIYKIEDNSKEHDDLYLVYQSERVIFVGRSQGGLSQNTKILGYHEKKDDVFHNEIGVLQLRGDFIQYELGSNGRMVSGSAKEIKEIPLSLLPEQTFTEADPSGFRIGEANGNDAISRMTSLTGVRIEEIEQNARPGGLSISGFLGDTESFAERLKEDNSFVTGAGFHHADLAKPLFQVMNVLDGIGDSEFDDFTYNGGHYKASYREYRGSQESIFNDGIQSDRDYEVTNLATGKTLHFSQMVPYYIARYGFYEGQTPYRVEPADIIAVFQLRGRS